MGGNRPQRGFQRKVLEKAGGTRPQRGLLRGYCGGTCPQRGLLRGYCQGYRKGYRWLLRGY